MNIDTELLDALTAAAKESPRKRMNFDLRTSSEDGSQRMLNALEPETVVPVHRHRGTTEVVVMLRGRAVQYLYDGSGNVTDEVLLEAASCAGSADASGAAGSGSADASSAAGPGSAEGALGAAGAGSAEGALGAAGAGSAEGASSASTARRSCPAMSIEKGRWHRLVSLESGTVIFEAKDGPFEPLADEDVMR